PCAFVSALRTGTHTGYDRLTIDFSNGGPSGAVELRPQSGTTFTQSPSGMTVTLNGKNGIMVVIHGADLHSSYSGSVDIVTGYATLVEVKRLEDFEGVVQLGLVDNHILLPVQTDQAKCCGDEIANRAHDPRRNHIVVSLVLLQHQPHGFDVVARVAPVSLRLQIAESKLVGFAGQDLPDAACDL